jgi:hypothetical protein
MLLNQIKYRQQFSIWKMMDKNFAKRSKARSFCRAPRPIASRSSAKETHFAIYSLEKVAKLLKQNVFSQLLAFFAIEFRR